MADNELARCGICPITHGGWALAACIWHDQAYTKCSWQQQHLSRKYVDDVFYRQLLELAKRGRYRRLKRIQAAAMYRIVRLVGSIYWEGREYGEPELTKIQMVQLFYDNMSDLQLNQFINEFQTEVTEVRVYV